MNSIQKQQQELLATFGWYSHCIPSGDNTPYGFNYHTHGLENSYNHRNIQIVMPVDHGTAHAIVADLIDRIKTGTVFIPDIEYHDIIKDFPAKFIYAVESGRQVLRLVFPGPDGSFDGTYAKQFSKLDNNEGLPSHQHIFTED